MLLVKYYHTLNDVLSGLDSPIQDIDQELQNIFDEEAYPMSTMFNDTATTETLTKAFALYGDEYVQITDTETSDFTAFCKKILRWVESTYGYYKKLIAANTSYSDLAAGVEITEQHGYADLPQQDDFSLDPETADNKINELDLRKGSDQRKTPIERLKDIENRYNDPYHLWILSFAREFIINPIEGLEGYYEEI